MQMPKHGEVEGPRSPRWALFRIMKIYRREGILYLTRFRILDTPWFGLYLHFIYTPDGDRDLHDHPWNFLSLLLWGWYTEVIPLDGRHQTIRVRWINFKRAEDQHRIHFLSRDMVVSLVIRGARRREWGFYAPEGWIPWQEYV